MQNAKSMFIDYKPGKLFHEVDIKDNQQGGRGKKQYAHIGG